MNNNKKHLILLPGQGVLIGLPKDVVAFHSSPVVWPKNQALTSHARKVGNI
jgi:hypothetical protein